mmetsp:Transcript_92711/g.261331  ORF Transcript_92711/g.261331 Transcript_92711/m.261331 type:complete len:204 (+) Transcript_92711:322-933(+)
MVSSSGSRPEPEARANAMQSRRPAAGTHPRKHQRLPRAKAERPRIATSARTPALGNCAMRAKRSTRSAAQSWSPRPRSKCLEPPWPATRGWTLGSPPQSPRRGRPTAKTPPAQRPAHSRAAAAHSWPERHDPGLDATCGCHRLRSNSCAAGAASARTLRQTPGPTLGRHLCGPGDPDREAVAWRTAGQRSRRALVDFSSAAAA